MNIIADLHTHTIASGHGADTIRTLSEFAHKRHLKGIGITDHGPGLQGGANVIYFIALNRLISGIKSHIRIITGVEDDIKNKKGELTLPEEVLSKLEIVMAGCHPTTWMASQSRLKRTNAVVNAINKGLIKVFTHPVGTSYDVELGPVIEAAKIKSCALELNISKLNDKKVAINFLKKCIINDVPIVINSDAHIGEEVGHFESAVTILKEIGFPERLIINTSEESISKFFGFDW